jgi:hypothetical protein
LTVPSSEADGPVRGPTTQRGKSSRQGLWDAGPILDRLIELRVFGRKPLGDVPPYSTDDSAADLVIARLAQPPIRFMCLPSQDGWTFHWRKPSAAKGQPARKLSARYVRLVSAAAPTRPLAVCRAALKLLGPVDPQRVKAAGD